MKISRPFIYLYCILVLSCNSNNPNSNEYVETQPANKNASLNTIKVFNYLSMLPKNKFLRVISGQNCGHGNEIYRNFLDHIAALNRKTGYWPGLIGVDYEYVKRFTPDQLSECNKTLIDYWQNGGLVTINWSPQNPWTDGGTRDLETGDFSDLYNPESDMYIKWHRQLDRIGNALMELQNAGVVVLWRPMQEMNGSWFWWGQTDQAVHYKEVFRDMFNYFTDTMKLNNLLWVYSTVSSGGSMTIRPVDFFYPGADYVDIIGTNVYESEQFRISDYAQYKEFGKPLALTECGPHHNKMNGTFDNTIVINAIRKRYPEIIYWTTWHDWPRHKVSMNSNQKAQELLSDPWVINRQDIAWNKD